MPVASAIAATNTNKLRLVLMHADGWEEELVHEPVAVYQRFQRAVAMHVPPELSSMPGATLFYGTCGREYSYKELRQLVLFWHAAVTAIGAVMPPASRSNATIEDVLVRRLTDMYSRTCTGLEHDAVGFVDWPQKAAIKHG